MVSTNRPGRGDARRRQETPSVTPACGLNAPSGLPFGDQSIFPVHGRRYSVGTPLPSRGGVAEGRGGVCIFFTDIKLETPPLPRLRPTVTSLPNCSPLAIALKGGKCLRNTFCHAPEITTYPLYPWRNYPEHNYQGWVNTPCTAVYLY